MASDLISRAELFNALATAQDKADCFAAIQSAKAVEAENVPENGCEYCEESYGLPEDWIGDRPVGKVFDTMVDCYVSGITHRFGWFLETPDGLSIGIRFCPCCGRKLPVEEAER